MRMKAELRSSVAPANARPILSPSRRANDGWRDVVFTIAQARRALSYVANIARDAAEAFHTVQRCRRLLHRSGSSRARQVLCEQRDRALRRLNRAIDDCNAAGAHLADLERGTLSFQGQVDGRLVCLLWYVDEAIDHAWREIESPRD
jgi:hypothetical protein